MKLINKLLLPAAIALLSLACEKDLIVQDITGKTLNVLAPGDSLSTQNNSVTFWWEKIEGAEKYELQIVSPSFANVQQFIADTAATGDKYIRTFQPGSYQWRIRATNSAGSTPWITRTLTIDTTSNLFLLSVALNSPADSFYTNTVQQTFSWSPLNAATSYTFKVLNSVGAQLYTNDQANTYAAYTFPSQNGQYTWQVRAQNSFSMTGFYSRKIFIDLSPPDTATLLSPGINATTVAFNSDSLKWSRGTGSWYDSLYVASDAAFSSIVTRQKITGASNYKITVANGFPSAGTYYWRVKSIDKAGNKSPFTSYRKFTAN